MCLFTEEVRGLLRASSFCIREENIVFYEKEENAMKLLRILWLIMSFIVLFPLIVVVEIGWLFYCIRAAHQFGESAKRGMRLWWDYVLAGVNMNKDFVTNGL